MPERLSLEDQSLLAGYAEHIQRYTFAASHCAGKRVLDAGCGTGYGSRFLASQGAAEVVAVDISEEAVSEARKLYHRKNLTFLTGDLHRLSETQGLNGPFDVVVNLENIEHLQDPPTFLREARKQLREGGLLVVSSPNGDLTERAEDGSIKNVFHVQEFTAPELSALLSVDFSGVELFGQWRTPEGKIRVETEYQYFNQLCSLYYSPIARADRFLKKLLGRSIPPPPEFNGAGTSYTGEFAIGPLDDALFPWPPEVLLAVARV